MRSETNTSSWFSRSKYGLHRSYRRSDDRIYEEACEALMRCPDVDASQISIQVIEGSVLLEGRIQGRHARKLAEYLIEDLPGVQEVRNELRVQRE